MPEPSPCYVNAEWSIHCLSCGSLCVDPGLRQGGKDKGAEPFPGLSCVAAGHLSSQGQGGHGLSAARCPHLIVLLPTPIVRLLLALTVLVLCDGGVVPSLEENAGSLLKGSRVCRVRRLITASAPVVP